MEIHCYTIEVIAQGGNILASAARPESPQGGDKMTNYEVMFILDSALEEDAKNAAVEMVKNIITAEGGEVTKEDIWGTKKLAYPIQKKNEGYYAVVEFQAGTELPEGVRQKIEDF